MTDGGKAELRNKAQSLLLISLAMLGVAGTLGGVWLGGYLGRGNEERMWLLDHKSEAYSEVLRASTIVTFEADAAYVSECATLDQAKQGGIVLEKVAEMYRAADKATLLGPKEIHQPLSELALFFGNEIGSKSIACPKTPEDEWGKIRKASVELYVKFMNAARNDLGVHPPLLTIEEWGKILNRTK